MSGGDSYAFKKNQVVLKTSFKAPKVSLQRHCTLYPSEGIQRTIFSVGTLALCSGFESKPMVGGAGGDGGPVGQAWWLGHAEEVGFCSQCSVGPLEGLKQGLVF